MAACLVAKFFGLSPDEVENWPNPDFLDRQEFMFVQMETDEREMESATKKTGK
jgi:hypothetical protein